MDECLRAISGFKGTEDLSSDKLLDSPFTSDYVKTKAVSSAPVYGLESPASTEDESKMCVLASERWSEAIVKHMPMIIQHSSAMVGSNHTPFDLFVSLGTSNLNVYVSFNNF